jgi:MFS family permease
MSSRVSRSDLWRHSDFLKLWAGETVSLFGSQITTLALPLTAVLLLNVTPEEMGLLTALGFAPFLVVTLFAGVWLDRRRKRGVMAAANFGRAALLLLVPLLAAAGTLRFGHLALIVLLMGVLNILFELAYQSYLPELLDRDQLQDGNSKLFATASIAEIGGPGVAGALIETLTAPLALVFDAATFFFAGVSALLIRQREPEPTPPIRRENVWSQISGGLRLTFGNVYLRAFAGEAATYNFFNQALLTLFILYATETLRLTPGTLGLIFAAGSVGSLLGSVVTVRVARRLGMGRTMAAGAAVSSFVPIVIPLAQGAALLPLLLLAFFVTYFGIALTNVHTFSIRQALVPDHLRARMNASYRFVTWGVIPIASLLSGQLAGVIGVRSTLVVAALGLMSASLWLLHPRLLALRGIPPRIEDPVAVAAPVPVAGLLKP